MKVEIDNSLFERLNTFIGDTSFKKPEDLVNYILEEYLSQSEKKSDMSKSKSEKEILNNRLKNLGYL